jgi:hypothetical protein
MDSRAIDEILVATHALTERCVHAATPNALVLLRMETAIAELEATITKHIHCVQKQNQDALQASAAAARIQLDNEQSGKLQRACDALLEFYVAHYTYDAMFSDNPVLPLRVRDLTLLATSHVFALWLETLPDARYTRLMTRCARDYPRVVAAEACYEPNEPIMLMDSYTLWWSLYAFYIRTPEFRFDNSLYTYMNILMWRAMQLLVSVGDTHLLNVDAYRSPCRSQNSDGLFRFSPRFAADLGMLLRAFVLKFQAIYRFEQRVEHPTPASVEQVASVARWLRKRSRLLASVYTQQNYSKMLMRAGECDFYEAEESASYVEQVVLQRYRPTQFTQFMEDTLRQPQAIIAQELEPVMRGKLQYEPPSLILTAFDTLLERIHTYVPNVRAENYVVLEWQLMANNMQGFDAVQGTREPVLVNCFNSVQLWDGATQTLHMYNSVLHSLVHWVLLVRERHNTHLAQCNASALCDEILGAVTVPVEAGAAAAAKSMQSLGHF